MQQLQPDTTLQSGKYRIIRTLGQGGFGITYLAEQVMLDRKVAIKEFFMKELCGRDGSTSHVTLGTEGSRETVQRFREKFLKEARNIAKLNHPNIVKIIDVFEENGTAYYVMEYAEGGSLADKVNRQGYLSEPVATRYIMQVAEALAYVHARKMNHLDVKPANIMLTGTDTAVLIDFGLSKQYNVGGQQTSTTPVGISEGYAPMEQYKQGGVGEFSPETDIYALGATFFKMLTGITPPCASDVNEEGVPVDELKSKGVSEKVIKVICEAMKPRKKDRMKDARVFLKKLSGSSPMPSQTKETEENTCILAESPELLNDGETMPDREPVSANEYGKEKGLPTSNSKKKSSTILKKTLIVLSSLAIIGTIIFWSISQTEEDHLLVIPYQYDGADAFSEGLAVVEKEGKWGYIDKKGDVIIPFLYEFANSFSEGMAAVQKEGRWGYIDKKGNEVVPCQYDFVSNFSDGLGKVEKNSKYGFVNNRGEVVVPCKYTHDKGESDIRDDFHEGLLAKTNGGKYGYIDKEGKEVIPYKYEDVQAFSEGLACVKKDGKWGFIDKTGNEVVPCQYDFVSNFSEGVAGVAKGGKAGYINKEGTEVIPCQYDYAYDFSEGLAMVMKQGNYSFIDINEKTVIKCAVLHTEVPNMDLYKFHENMALVNDGSKYGYIDKSGNEVVPCRYDYASGFSEGMALVSKGEKWGFIKKP